MTEQNIALVAAFNRQGNVLLLKRPDDIHCGGLWSFPGGKVRDSESALEAAGRELQEETELNGEQWQELGESVFDYADRRLHFFLFSCLCPDTSQLHAEDVHTWASPDDLESYPMPAANGRLLVLLRASRPRSNGAGAT